jgi:hypothetical protein
MGPHTRRDGRAPLQFFSERVSHAGGDVWCCHGAPAAGVSAFGARIWALPRLPACQHARVTFAWTGCGGRCEKAPASAPPPDFLARAAAAAGWASVGIHVVTAPAAAVPAVPEPRGASAIALASASIELLSTFRELVSCFGRPVHFCETIFSLGYDHQH